jgi:hypothetical protein
VSEQSGSVGTTTNGKHPIADAGPSLGIQEGQPYNEQSVDERLEALMQTIRTWDWRSPSAESDPANTGEPGQSLASAPISSDPSRDLKGPGVVPVVPPRPSAPNVLVPTAPNVQDPTNPAPRHAKADPLATQQPEAPAPSPAPSSPETSQGPPTPISAPAVESELAVVDSHQVPPPTVEPLPAEKPPSGPPPTLPSTPQGSPEPPTLTVATPVEQFASLPGLNAAFPTPEGPQPGAKPYPGAVDTKGRTRLKVLLLCIAAAVVVLLIIGAIRLFSGTSQGSGPSEPPPTTAVTTTTAHTASSVDQAPLPISSAQLTEYEHDAQGLNEANITATKALAGKTALTTAEVVPVAAIYSTALNTYSLALSYIEWPAALQTAVKADQAQLVITASYLKSIDAVSPTGLNSWIAQLKAQATTTETMDNALRQELDLPKTTAFPT